MIEILRANYFGYQVFMGFCTECDCLVKGFGDRFGWFHRDQAKIHSQRHIESGHSPDTCHQSIGKPEEVLVTSIMA